MYQRQRSSPEKFWSHVAIQQDNNACWEWQAYRKSNRYGELTYKRQKWIASRLAYVLANNIDVLPVGMHVCHKCDNPPCCNPNHLFLGTAKDNVHDAMKKGRAYLKKGAEHPSAKMTEEKVRKIRLLHELGFSYKEIGRVYDIDIYQVRAIVKKRSWAHVTS